MVDVEGDVVIGDGEVGGVEDFGNAAGEAVGDQHRTAEDERVAALGGGEQVDRRMKDGVLFRLAAVAGVDGGGEAHALDMVEADEGELQQTFEAVAGLDVGMIGPGDVGEEAGGLAQPSFAHGLVPEQLRGPALQRLTETGDAGARHAEGAGPLDERIVLLLVLFEAAEKEAFAQAQGGDGDPLR